MAAPLRRLLLLGLLFLPLALRAGEPEDFKLIQRLLKEGARRTAAEQCLAYLERYPAGPHRPTAAFQAGRFLLEQGRDEEALPLLREASRGLKGGEATEASLDLAQALLQLRRAAEAAQVLQALPPPKGASAHRALTLKARAADALDDPVGVAAALRQIPERQLAPEDRYLLALSLAATGKDREALRILGDLAGAPGVEGDLRNRVLRSLAEARYRAGDLAGAEEAFAAAAGKADPSAALLLGWIRLAEGRPDEAYDTVRRALPLEGWEEAAALASVRAAALRRDGPGTLAAVRDLLARFPRGSAAAEARLTGARLLARENRSAEALALLEPVLASLDGEEARIEGALLAARTAWNGLRDARRARKWLDFAREAALSDGDRQRVALETARLDWETGEASSALEGLSALIEKSPESPSAPAAALLMGRILLAEGHRDKALSLLRTVVEAYPDAPEARQALLAAGEDAAAGGDGELLASVVDAGGAFAFSGEEARRFDRLAFEAARRRGDLEEARLRLLASSQPVLDPEQADEARYLAALLDLAAGRTEQAREALPALLSPTRRLALGLRTADGLFASGDPRGALSLLEELERDFPDRRGLLLLTAANGALAAALPEEGRGLLARLAALGPSDALSVLGQRRLERILLTEEGPEAALKAVPAFLEAEPTAVSRGEALLRRARILARKGDPAASRLFRQYLDLRPSGPGAAEARLHLAREALAQGRPAEARNLAEGLPSAEARRVAGEAAFALRDMEGTLKALGPVLADPAALPPEDRVRALFLAATAARVLGRSEEAETRFTAFSREAPPTPGNLEDLLTAALYLQKQGRLPEALAALDRLKSAFRDARVAFQYAYTLELLGRTAEALDAYLQVAFGSASAEWALTARYRAAEILAATGRREDAAALYRQLVERTEGTVQGDYAKRRLEELEKKEASPPEEAPVAPAQAPH